MHESDTHYPSAAELNSDEAREADRRVEEMLSGTDSSAHTEADTGVLPAASDEGGSWDGIAEGRDWEGFPENEWGDTT